MLKKENVEFLIIGAHALARYTRPRFTEDLDVFVRRTRENASRLRRALAQFGFDIGVSGEEKLAEDLRAILILGVKPNQIDILNFIDGVEFEDALEGAEPGRLGEHDILFLGLDEVIKNKIASGRSKDFEDLNRVRELREYYNT